MKKKMSKGQLVFRLIIAVAVTVIFLGAFLSLLDRFIDGMMHNFSQGWTVSFDGHATQDADLYTYRFNRHIRRGDTVILEKNIPLTIGDEMILSFDGRFSACSVKVDGEDIYTYGYDLMQRHIVPGNATHVVLLPTNAAGTRCRVILTAGMDNAFKILPIFYMVPAQNETACYTNQHVITNTIAFILFTLGLVMLVISIILGLMGRHYDLVIAIGWLTFAIGIWTLCNTHLMDMFSRDYVMNTMIEYASLYLSVIPLLTIMYLIRKPGSNIWQKVCVGISYAIIGTFMAFVIVLGIAHLAHPAVFLSLAHVAALVSFVFMFIGTYKKDSSDRPYRIYAAALTILFAGYILDMVRYYLSDVIRVDSRIMFTSVLPVISFIFIIMMMAAYLMQLDSHYMHSAELEIADQIAFTDVATGLKNRTYCNHLFEKLEGRPADEKFQIVNFDINDVGKINNSLGRAAGDMLIKDCAVILQKAFAGTGEVIQMGGDEFIAVIYNGKYRDVKNALSRVEKLETHYEFRRKYEIRLSYGAASSNEKEGMTPEAVYQRANERMYAMKKETKYSAY